jgi:hypothetical protein
VQLLLLLSYLKDCAIGKGDFRNFGIFMRLLLDELLRLKSKQFYERKSEKQFSLKCDLIGDFFLLSMLSHFNIFTGVNDFGFFSQFFFFDLR